MSKKIVYVDMDGVIADFDKAMAGLDPLLDIKDGENWEERSKKVDEICLRNPRIFLYLDPIEGAIDAVKNLMSKYEVYILSSPMWALPSCFMDKRLWLENHFGDDIKHRLILSKRKDLNIGDFIIDDTKRNGVSEFKGVHLHFGVDYKNWDEIIKYFNLL